MTLHVSQQFQIEEKTTISAHLANTQLHEFVTEMSLLRTHYPSLLSYTTGKHFVDKKIIRFNNLGNNSVERETLTNAHHVLRGALTEAFIRLWVSFLVWEPNICFACMIAKFCFWK